MLLYQWEMLHRCYDAQHTLQPALEVAVPKLSAIPLTTCVLLFHTHGCLRQTNVNTALQTLSDQVHKLRLRWLPPAWKSEVISWIQSLHRATTNWVGPVLKSPSRPYDVQRSFGLKVPELKGANFFFFFWNAVCFTSQGGACLGLWGGWFSLLRTYSVGILHTGRWRKWNIQSFSLLAGHWWKCYTEGDPGHNLEVGHFVELTPTALLVVSYNKEAPLLQKYSNEVCKC